MQKKRTKARTTAKQPKRSSVDEKLPFLEHFKELKRRLTIVAVSISAVSIAAYFVQQQIVVFLLKPATGQKLIYTSPGGGLDFLFRVCFYTGIVVSLPVIVYQILKYLEPLVGENSARFTILGSCMSGILAIAGMAFGYYAGLPATLHFLFHQFTTDQIHPLIAIHSYMKFISLYMFGAALLFQVPLVLLFINRIKPLKPSTLWNKQRWMILFSFVLAVLMNPTPNVIDQLMLAGPMILMYNVGIVMIFFVNRPKHSRKISALLAQDAQIRAERIARLRDAQTVWHQAGQIAEYPAVTLEQMTQRPATMSATIIAESGFAAEPLPNRRQRKYVDGFTRSNIRTTS